MPRGISRTAPRLPEVNDGYLKRYAALVTSGNRGAILELPASME